MSLSSHRSCLEALAKEARQHWEEARACWRDARGDAFALDYMEPFLISLEKAAAVCEQLDQIVSKARHECE